MFHIKPHVPLAHENNKFDQAEQNDGKYFYLFGWMFSLLKNLGARAIFKIMSSALLNFLRMLRNKFQRKRHKICVGIDTEGLEQFALKRLENLSFSVSFLSVVLATNFLTYPLKYCIFKFMVSSVNLTMYSEHDKKLLRKFFSSLPDLCFENFKFSLFFFLRL